MHHIPGTEPSEEQMKDQFIRALGEKNIHWLFEIDQGDHDKMAQEEIANRLDAHLKEEVKE